LSPASGEACDAIENGFADLADPILKDRIAELKAARDQARADAEGPRVRPHGSGRHQTKPALSKRSPGPLAGACEAPSTVE
jgi:hypothetical protein